MYMAENLDKKRTYQSDLKLLRNTRTVKKKIKHMDFNNALMALKSLVQCLFYSF